MTIVVTIVVTIVMTILLKTSPAEEAAFRCLAWRGFFGGRRPADVDVFTVPTLVRDLYRQFRPAAGLVRVLKHVTPSQQSGENSQS